MARFRQEKERLARMLQSADWHAAVEGAFATAQEAKTCLNPLLSFLNRPELRAKAAHALGLAVARIAGHSMEEARIIMRRLMWSMNEESGNLGWGIPEAMACILAESPPLAGEYTRILLSYGHDTGIEDNFIDHAPLRRGVYWGIGRLAAARPELVLPSLHILIAALDDEDPEATGMAAFAVSQLAASAPQSAFDSDQADWRALLAVLEDLAGAPPASLELFDGTSLRPTTTTALAQEAYASIEARLAAK